MLMTRGSTQQGIKMKYSVVALDLDGTLLGSDLRIRQDAADAIRLVRAAGVRVVMATGRHHTAAYPYHHQLGLDTPLMCCNGTYAWDATTRSTLMPRPLQKSQARKTLSFVREYEVHTLVYVDNAMTYETSEPHLVRLLNWARTLPESVRPAICQVDDFHAQIDSADNVWKFAVTAPSAERMHAFSDAVQQNLGLSCEWSATDRVDIAQSGNSKGRLLTEWLDSQGISPSSAIAIGDSPNDISMLSAVGLGVAMANSAREVQAAAGHVAGSNDSPAIATILHQHVLGTQN